MKGRAAPAKLDAFVYAERGVYRSNETVFLTALLRDAQGTAVAQTPLTLVVKRPDGVEFLRTTTTDQGLGGRSLSFKLPASANSGGWTVEAFVDPKSPALGETSFLVEDYVPERMDMTLAAKAANAKPGETINVDATLRYLYGAPGAGLNISGDVEISQARDHGLPALAGFEAGTTDEEFSNSQERHRDRRRNRRRGQGQRRNRPAGSPGDPAARSQDHAARRRDRRPRHRASGFCAAAAERPA